MNIDFYSKYIKYKTKYLLLKNNINPNDENNISIGGGKKKLKKTYIFVDNQLGEEFVKLLDSKGWVRKDINEFPEYVDLLYYQDPKNFYNLLKK